MPRTVSLKWLTVGTIGGVLLLSPTAQTQTPAPQQNTPTASASAAASATVKQYCIGCHSAALKTGGVVLDPATLTQVSSNAETWERAIKQLRAKSMPPVPMPRPDARDLRPGRVVP